MSYVLNNCFIRCFNRNYELVTFDTWEELMQALGGYKNSFIDICCEEGYHFKNDGSDGYFFYENAFLDETQVKLKDGVEIDQFTVKLNPLYNYDEDTINTEFRIEVKNGDVKEQITDLEVTPSKKEPPKPDKPNLLRIYPEELLENVYIDNWHIRTSATGEEIRVVEKYPSVKDFLIKSDGSFKESLTFQADEGFNFNKDDSDGYITFYDGETYSFKYIWDNGVPIEDYSPNDNRDLSYPNARKFVFLSGEDYSDGKDDYIIIKRYTDEIIDLDLYGKSPETALIYMTNEDETTDPPLQLEWSKIARIQVRALKQVEIPIKNLAFSTYILSGEDIIQLRKEQILYNEIVINTYNYPLKFDPETLIETNLKFESANMDFDVLEFKSVKNEIEIFKFKIPILENVSTITLYPIFKSGIPLNYDIVKGKTLTGISEYEASTNTNILKLYVDDVLIDYYEYDIQTPIPLNWDTDYMKHVNTIGNRIPYLKSYIIITYNKLEQVSMVNKFLKGEVLNIDSKILKDEFEILKQLIQEGIYYDDKKVT